MSSWNKKLPQIDLLSAGLGFLVGGGTMWVATNYCADYVRNWWNKRSSSAGPSEPAEPVVQSADE